MKDKWVLVLMYLGLAIVFILFLFFYLPFVRTISYPKTQYEISEDVCVINGFGYYSGGSHGCYCEGDEGDICILFNKGSSKELNWSTIEELGNDKNRESKVV